MRPRNSDNGMVRLAEVERNLTRRVVETMKCDKLLRGEGVLHLGLNMLELCASELVSLDLVSHCLREECT